MNELLAVYNICGLGGVQNVGYYVRALRSLLAQDLPGLQIVVSSCMSQPNVQQELINQFSDKIHFNWIQESLPLNVTFNHTVKQCIKRMGVFDGYLYVDSGINFDGKPDAVRRMYDVFKSGPYAMVAAKASNDTGFSWWHIPDTQTLYTFPVGRTANLHVQIFDHRLYENYDDRLMPDIFANDTSESVYTFLCAAINKKFVMHQGIELEHAHSMDGASAGWRHTRFFNWDSNPDALYAAGKEFGFGYEEIDPRWQSDKSKFDQNGYARDPRLLPFIRENLFVPSSRFSYEAIKANFSGVTKK